MWKEHNGNPACRLVLLISSLTGGGGGGSGPAPPLTECPGTNPKKIQLDLFINKHSRRGQGSVHSHMFQQRNTLTHTHLYCTSCPMHTCVFSQWGADKAWPLGIGDSFPTSLLKRLRNVQFCTRRVLCLVFHDAMSPVDSRSTVSVWHPITASALPHSSGGHCRLTLLRLTGPGTDSGRLARASSS